MKIPELLRWQKCFLRPIAVDVVSRDVPVLQLLV